MRQKLETGLTVVVGLCTIVLTALVLRREFAPPVASAAAQVAAPRVIANWQEYAAAGRRMGPNGARILITEFADFECPACAAAVPVLTEIRAKYPNDVAVMFRHFPLAYHRFARPAAQAAECAAEADRFESFHDLLWATKDSLGLIPFSRLAARAGVADTAASAACLDRPGDVPRIEADIAAGRALGVPGTPTFLVNDRFLEGPPTTRQLEALIDQLLSEQ
jgi:protein-disulfide isomerase